MNVAKYLDRVLEELEIRASNNYYPLEKDTNYQRLEVMANHAYKNEDDIDLEEWQDRYEEVMDAIANY